MRLLCHIVAKDARRFWPLVLLWSVLFTLHQFSVWRVERSTVAENAEVLARLRFIEVLTFVVQLLTTYIFAGTLVLEDTAVGTSMFWPTRPISGARLFAAKAVSSVLWFGGLAILLSLPWWMAGDEAQLNLSYRAKALLSGQICLILTAFVFASFTGTLEKFLGWSLGYVLFVAGVG